MNAITTDDAVRHTVHRGSYRWIIIILLTLLGMVNFADKAVIGFAALPIMKDLGLSHEEFGFASGAFFWLFSISAIVIGWMSDRIKTKPLIAFIAVIWSAVQFLSIFIGSLFQLTATRALLGASEGPSYNLSLHHAEKWLLPSQRGTGFGLVSVGSPLGPALMAPPLVYIIFHSGWRFAFLLLGVIGIIWTLVWLFVAEERPSPQSATTPSGIEGGIIHTADQSPHDWYAVVSAVLTRNFIFTVLAVFTSYWGLITLVVWVPAYLEEVRHITHAQAVIYLGLPWFAAAAAAFLTGILSDYLYKLTHDDRKSRVYVIGITGILAGIFWFLFPHIGNIGLAVGSVVLAIGLGQPAFPLGSAVITASTKPQYRGAALGAMVCLMALAGLVSPMITGALVQHAATKQAGYSAAFYLCAVITLVANIIMMMVVSPEQGKHHAA